MIVSEMQMRTCPQPLVAITLTALQLENSIRTVTIENMSNTHREAVSSYHKSGRTKDFKI